MPPRMPPKIASRLFRPPPIALRQAALAPPSPNACGALRRRPPPWPRARLPTRPHTAPQDLSPVVGPRLTQTVAGALQLRRFQHWSTVSRRPSTRRRSDYASSSSGCITLWRIRGANGRATRRRGAGQSAQCNELSSGGALRSSWPTSSSGAGRARAYEEPNQDQEGGQDVAARVAPCGVYGAQSGDGRLAEEGRKARQAAEGGLALAARRLAQLLVAVGDTARVGGAERQACTQGTAPVVEARAARRLPKVAICVAQQNEDAQGCARVEIGRGAVGNGAVASGGDASSTRSESASVC